MIRRHTLLGLLTLASACGLAAAPALAQDAWPNKPVKLMSPFPAGGTSDVIARLVGEALGKELGQQILVENVGGAGGTVGTLRATKQAADGYTLIQTGVGQNAVAHGLDPKLGYDSMRDFVHLAQTHSGPNVLVVNAATPFKTFAELVDYVRKNPGKLNYGFTHAAAHRGQAGGHAEEGDDLTRDQAAPGVRRLCGAGTGWCGLHAVCEERTGLVDRRHQDGRHQAGMNRPWLRPRQRLHSHRRG
jgi:hypothetical protein